MKTNRSSRRTADGVAYYSNEGGGSPEVYVRPFPGPGGKWRVSTEGGYLPRWSAMAHELLFLDPNQYKVMFAPYAIVGDSFRAGKPQIWSPVNIRSMPLTNQYDLHPDGKRLAVSAAPDLGAVQDKVVFVSNFFDYLQKIVPAHK